MNEFGRDPTPMKRSFADLNDKLMETLLEGEYVDFFGRDHGIEWSELLESQRVFIIAEQGSGKTHECRDQQKRLSDSGVPAFFFELSELARETDPSLLLTPEEVALFGSWSSSGDEIATFFLDAHDELKLTQQKFRTALTKRQRYVHPNADRVRLIVTSRPGPFDRDLVTQLFPVQIKASEPPSFVDAVLGATPDSGTEHKGKQNPLIRTVGMVPLRERDITGYTTSVALPESDRFIQELRDKDALVFARRSQDLIELCQDWRDHREIRSHRDQISSNVTVKLKPRSDRPEPASLPDDKARDGARRLALSALLTKKLTIRHSPELSNPQENDAALDPGIILHDWSPEERQTLLERALFSFAAYGRVRFHHRSVLEFLAAEQLCRQRRDGMSSRALKRILFATTPQGVDVVRPSLRPTAAWVALEDDAIFLEIIQREPEALISEGDPSCFLLSQKQAILSAFIERYQSGTWRGMNVPQIQTQRFVSRDLGQTAKALWDAGIENGEMREFLFELAAAGPLPELGDAAENVFLDPDAPEGERIAALRALMRIGDDRLHRIAETVANEPLRWSNRLLEFSVVELFPEFLSGDPLRQVLSTITPSKETLGNLSWSWPNAIAETNHDSSILAELREMLCDLVTAEVRWNEGALDLTTSRPDLLPALATLCKRELTGGVVSDAAVGAIAATLRLGVDTRYGEDRPVSNLRTTVTTLSPALRSRIFWADDELIRTYGKAETPSERAFRVGHEGATSIDGRTDRGWLLEAVADQRRSDEQRLFLLYVIRFRLPHDQTDPETHWQEIRRAVADSATLDGEVEQWLAPREPDPQWEEHEERTRPLKEEREEQGKANRAAWHAFEKRLAESPDDEFSEGKVHGTCWNLWKAMRNGDRSGESGWDRRFIEQHFGPAIADRLRTAMMREWRKISPPLNIERADDERNTVQRNWRFALAGVYAEAEGGDWAAKLSAKEAEQAARIATHKLNGLPRWLGDLAAAHPDVIADTLGPDMSFELENSRQWSRYLQALRDVEFPRFGGRLWAWRFQPFSGGPFVVDG